MRKYLILVLASFIATPGIAFQCGERPFTSTRFQDGTQIGLFAESEHFEGAQTWEINNGEPPLSISQAITIVQEWAETFYERYDSVKVSNLRLQEFGCGEARHHWLYVFNLTPVIDGHKLYGGAYMAAVTMSGKVIEPRKFSE